MTNVSVNKNSYTLYVILFVGIFVSMYMVGEAGLGAAVFAKAVFYGFGAFLLFSSIFKNVVVTKNRQFSFFFWFGMLVIWMFFRSENYYGMALASQFLLVMLFAIPYGGFSEVERAAFYQAVKLSTLFFLFVSIIHFFLYPVFANSNFWGAYCLFYLVVSASIGGRFGRLCVFIFLLFLVLSGTRSAMLGAVVGGGVLLFLRIRLLYKIVFFLVFSIFIVSLYFFGFIDYILSDDFSSAVAEHTGKRLESGRLQIWTSIFSSMKMQDWFFGIGGGFDLKSLIGLNLSAHSGYVYVLSSYGIVGLSVFLALSVTTLFFLCKKKWDYSFFLMVAFLIREFFETSLVNNNFPIAVMFWGVLASGALDRIVAAKSISHRQSN